MDFQLTSKYTPAEHIGYMGSYVTTTRSLTRSTVALILPQPWTPYIPAGPLYIGDCSTKANTRRLRTATSRPDF